MSQPLGYDDASYDVEIPYVPSFSPLPLPPTDAEAGIPPPPEAPKPGDLHAQEQPE